MPANTKKSSPDNTRRSGRVKALKTNPSKKENFYAEAAEQIKEQRDSRKVK